MTEAERWRRVLLDTGPLVAIRNPQDPWHERCALLLERMEPPLITTWPVITEAAWLLRRDTKVVGRMLRGAAEGLYSIADLTASDLLEIDKLRQQYRDLAPQLADLTLVHLANREKLDTVFTLDQRDFRVFRLKHRRQLRLLPGDE